MEHTETPWETLEHRPMGWTILKGNDIIATLSGNATYRPEQGANAAFIVRCVNSHDALVEALAFTTFALKEMRPHGSLTLAAEDAIELGVAALAKAKKEG